jgi:hypothetical protein
MTNKNTPKYRKQNNKYGAVAFIVLNQQRYYLGTYDSTARYIKSLDELFCTKKPAT